MSSPPNSTFPVFTAQWATLKGFSPSLPTFNSLVNPEFGKVLVEPLLKKAQQDMAKCELRKLKWWNLVVHAKDGRDEIFAGEFREQVQERFG